MADILESVARAISCARKLKNYGDASGDPDLKNLLADLNLELADTRMELVVLLEEHAALQKQAREADGVKGDICPRCRQRGWNVESSRPDRVYGELGGMRRQYRCSQCGFAEERLDVPKMV
jgi:hypothetical protein